MPTTTNRSPAPPTADDPPELSATQTRALHAAGAHDAPPGMQAQLRRFMDMTLVLGEHMWITRRREHAAAPDGGLVREDRWTIQLTIAAVRTIGRAVAHRNGQHIDLVEPVWLDQKTQKWHGHWAHRNASAAARIGIAVVHRDGRVERNVGIANFHEHVVCGEDGQPIPEWMKAPASLLALYAEHQAWAKTYPRAFANTELVTTPPATALAIVPSPTPPPVAVSDPPHDTAPDTAPPGEESNTQRTPEIRALASYLTTGFGDDNAAWAWVSGVIGRDVGHLADLNDLDLRRLVPDIPAPEPALSA